MSDEQRTEAILFKTRDHLADIAARKRAWCEQGVRLGGIPMTDREREDLAALDAGAGCMNVLISMVQEWRLKKPDLTRRDVPEWFIQICSQARASYAEGAASDAGKEVKHSVAGVD